MENHFKTLANTYRHLKSAKALNQQASRDFSAYVWGGVVINELATIKENMKWKHITYIP